MGYRIRGVSYCPVGIKRVKFIEKLDFLLFFFSSFRYSMDITDMYYYMIFLRWSFNITMVEGLQICVQRMNTIKECLI